MINPNKAKRIALQQMLLMDGLSIADAMVVIETTKDLLLNNHKVAMSNPKNTSTLESVGLTAQPPSL